MPRRQAFANQRGQGHISAMEQEIRRPDYVPRVQDRTSSTLSCFIAAAGVTLMTLCLLGSAAVVSVWAIANLLGLGQTVMFILIALVMAVVVAITMWTAGRAWYLERRVALGGDVDAPVFKTFHYFQKKP